LCQKNLKKPWADISENFNIKRSNLIFQQRKLHVMERQNAIRTESYPAGSRDFIGLIENSKNIKISSGIEQYYSSKY
jgi:hypothetical protein